MCLSRELLVVVLLILVDVLVLLVSLLVHGEVLLGINEKKNTMYYYYISTQYQMKPMIIATLSKLIPHHIPCVLVRLTNENNFPQRSSPPFDPFDDEVELALLSVVGEEVIDDDDEELVEDLVIVVWFR